MVADAIMRMDLSRASFWVCLFWATVQQYGGLQERGFAPNVVLHTGMMCQAKTSYIDTDIEWGARFESRMSPEKGSFRADLRRFHTAHQVPLTRCSASQAHRLMTLAQDSRATKDWGTWTKTSNRLTVDSVLIISRRRERLRTMKVKGVQENTHRCLN